MRGMTMAYSDNTANLQDVQNEMKRIRRMRRMKFSGLGENGEWHKLEPISANFQPKKTKNIDIKYTS